MQISSSEECLSFSSPLNMDQKDIIKQPYTESSFGRALAYSQEISIGDVVKASEMVTFATGAVGSISFVNAKRTGGKENGRLILDCLNLCGKTTIVAFCLFESVSIIHNLREIQASPAYLAWKNSRIQMMKDNSIIIFLQKDDILRHLLCPLSGKIPEIPATLQNRKEAYDYSSAIEWINENPETPFPGVGKIVKKEDFLFDFPHINSIFKRLENLNELVKCEIKNKIYQILGVKISSDRRSRNNLERLISIAEIIVDNKISTIAEMFSGGVSFWESSLGYLHQVKSVCFTKKKKAQKITLEKKKEEKAEIARMPKKTPEQKSLKKDMKLKIKGKLRLHKLITKITIIDQSLAGSFKSLLGYETSTVIYSLNREGYLEKGNEKLELIWQ